MRRDLTKKRDTYPFWLPQHERPSSHCGHYTEQDLSALDSQDGARWWYRKLCLQRGADVESGKVLSGGQMLVSPAGLGGSKRQGSTKRVPLRTFWMRYPAIVSITGTVPSTRPACQHCSLEGSLEKEGEYTSAMGLNILRGSSCLILKTILSPTPLSFWKLNHIHVSVYAYFIVESPLHRRSTVTRHLTTQHRTADHRVLSSSS